MKESRIVGSDESKEDMIKWIQEKLSIEIESDNLEVAKLTEICS